MHSSKLTWFFSLLLTLLISACGGSISFGPNPPDDSNVVPISVYSGGNFLATNSLFVTIRLCSPNNSAQCTTIDRILVDTGSVGLRVFAQPSNASALSTLNLTQQTVGGQPIAECHPFSQGVTWGPIKYATLQIGERVASNVALQVIADPQFAAVPTACTNQGTLLNNVTSLRANGILGLQPFQEDCGDDCANGAQNVYFSCSTNNNNCVNTTQALANQLQNPVTLFGSDNNGVIITLDSVPSDGATFVNGTLTFGVDTRSNNASTNSNTIVLDENGFFTTTLNGTNYPASFFDTGSNGYFFDAPAFNAISGCANYPGFYCPPNTLTLNATMTGAAGSTSPANVSFNIANADSLFDNQDYFAFNNIGGDIGDNTLFDWGLPFFYGRSVYIVIDGQSSNRGDGPYVGW